MKKLFLMGVVFFAFLKVESQELYVYTEPASNMPAKTVGLKFTALYPSGSSFKQRYKPELMVGINKNWMLHLSSTFSDYYSANTRYESGKAYVKYRFYSNDDVHRHFRMAAFADIAFTRSPYLYDEISLDGDNDGAQVGIIATKLVNKFAVSGTAAYTGLFSGTRVVGYEGPHALNSINYSLSAGYLVLPKEYVDYRQANLNLYIELLGAKILDNNRYAVDLAPALQLIFNSNTKINVGYRFEVTANMSRMARSTWLIGLEHTLFNVWR